MVYTECGKEEEVVRIISAAGLALLRCRATDATRWVEFNGDGDAVIPAVAAAAADGDGDGDANEPRSHSLQGDEPETHELHAYAAAAAPVPAPSLALRHESFDPRVEFLVVPPGDQHAPQNLVVLLHGRGDSHVPFANLARQMALPQTAAIALRAPEELPFDLGHTWYNDLDDEFAIIPPHIAHRRRSKSLQHARDFVWSFLETLRDSYRWPLERVFLLGFSQGACVAFQMAMTTPHRLGGIVLIAGGAVEGLHRPHTSTRSSLETPVLLLAGTRDTTYPPSCVQATCHQYASKYAAHLLACHTLNKAHEMIQSPDEMRLVMTFFAQHLFLRDTALEARADLIEITPPVNGIGGGLRMPASP